MTTADDQLWAELSDPIRRICPALVRLSEAIDSKNLHDAAEAVNSLSLASRVASETLRAVFDEAARIGAPAPKKLYCIVERFGEGTPGVMVPAHRGGGIFFDIEKCMSEAQRLARDAADRPFGPFGRCHYWVRSFISATDVLATP